jgi:hypothetical protein
MPVSSLELSDEEPSLELSDEELGDDDEAEDCDITPIN